MRIQDASGPVAAAILLALSLSKRVALGQFRAPRNLRNVMDEVWGCDLSVVAEYRFVGIGALKRVFLIYFTTSMNCHVIYFVNLPD
jgi:hypothetical protein